MNRSDIINTLIKKYNYKSYLEIGLDNPYNNYFNINCEFKECVEPYVNPIIGKQDVDKIITYQMTSDEFFKQNNKTYDIIFIDGFHTKEQVSRDIINSLKILNKGGKIVVHDCLPEEETDQLVPRASDGWTGDIWRTMCELPLQNIKFQVLDCDWGVGIIDYKDDTDNLHYITEWRYEWIDFVEKRDIILNVVNPDEYISKLN